MSSWLAVPPAREMPCGFPFSHRSLDKDAPFSRPVQRAGSIHSHAMLGGLHHQMSEFEFLAHTAAFSRGREKDPVGAINADVFRGLQVD